MELPMEANSNTDIPHALTREFSGQVEKLHLLRLSDPHFADITDDYTVLNAEIVDLEERGSPASDVCLEDMKKRRLKLLDEIAGYLC